LFTRLYRFLDRINLRGGLNVAKVRP
jgi:hypothetical protein